VQRLRGLNTLTIGRSGVSLQLARHIFEHGVHFAVSGAEGRDGAVGVQNGGVVSPAEVAPDLFQRVPCMQIWRG